MKYLILILTIITFLSGCSVFGIRSWEQPTYEILIEEGNYELRAYNSYVVAETVVSGTDFDEVSSKGFRVLADYIFGENYVRNSLLQESESISMTAPVILNVENPKLVIRPPSDTINMTSPVIVDKLGEINKWRMAFSLPSKWTLETAPIPKNERVTLRKMPEEQIIAMRFTNFMTMEKLATNEKKLRNWADRKEIEVEGDLRTARFDPQWTIPFLRRNEIHLLVKE